MAMQSKLLSVLLVLAILLTGLAASYVIVGPAVAIVWAIVSVLALVGWFGFAAPRDNRQPELVAPYIIVIVLALLLSTLRYMSGYVELLSTDFRSAFQPQFPLRDATWFAAFVVFPISLMLLGGYYLSKETPLGRYMAWWTALFAIVDGLLQFRIEIANSPAYNHLYFVGSLAALALIGAGVILCQRLLQPSVRPTPAMERGLTPRQINLWSLLLIALGVVYGAELFREAGPMPVAIIGGSMVGGLIGWRKTTALRPADPAKAVPLCLLLLALFYIHVGEEALTDFNQAIASLSGKPWADSEFTLFIGLAGPVVWIFSAWSLWHRQPFGNFVLWFLIVGMILGEPTHMLVFPFVAMHKFGIGYEYFSGMYTALFPMIPAILALVMLITDHRRPASRWAA